MSKVLAVIPARAGSKSIENKNIKLLDGKPLFAYSIEYAKKCSLVDKTIVSTDEQHYAKLARNFGAETPFIRPAQLAHDLSQDYDFMRHSYDYFETQGLSFDILILLRPTSPLRPQGLIEKGLAILKDNPNATSVRSVASVEEHPYRVWEINNDGSLCSVIKHEKEPYNIPRQLLPKAFFQTGDIELVRASTLLNGSVSGDKVYPLFIEHEQMVDIDNPEDFVKAQERM